MNQLFALIPGIALGLFTIANTASADKPGVMVEIYMTGEQLTQYCRAFLKTRRERRGSVQEHRDAGICYGFVAGVADALEIQGAGSDTRCLPKGTNANTLAEIVGAFLQKNPTLRIGHGFGLTVRALSEAYHCSLSYVP